MAKPSLTNLSRRERQIMDAVYRHEKATAVEIMKAIPDPPSNAAIRAKLQVLVKKGYLTYTREGLRYVYQPVVDKASAEASALKRLISTFYDGSPRDALQGMFKLSHKDLTDEDLATLKKMIEQAYKEGR